MASLVADYGSDSESEVYESSPKNNAESDGPLPKPKFDVENQRSIHENSVFINPFVEADKAEKAILEKHVKMISVDVKTVNGKKICWNYRKNKCRYGHNCKYAHDSDLQIDKSTITPTETKTRQIDLKKLSKNAIVDEPVKVRKKRPGMAQGIIPSKKVIKLYNEYKRKTRV